MKLSTKNLVDVFGMDKDDALSVMRLYRIGESHQKIMKRFDEIMGYYGIEPLESDKHGYFGKYVNTGETYDNTLVSDQRNVYSPRIFIGSWGDFYERTYFNDDIDE